MPNVSHPLLKYCHLIWSMVWAHAIILPTQAHPFSRRRQGSASVKLSSKPSTPMEICQKIFLRIDSNKKDDDRQCALYASNTTTHIVRHHRLQATWRRDARLPSAVDCDTELYSLRHGSQAIIVTTIANVNRFHIPTFKALPGKGKSKLRNYIHVCLGV